jgi:hypothetical protein
VTGTEIRFGRARWAFTGLLLALLLCACSGVRDNLGTANSPCYVALPAATGAVHHSGKLLGLRLDRVGSLRSARRLYLAAGGGHAGNERVCLVGFRGVFLAEDVFKPQGASAGSLAVVVLSYPDNHVLGTVILRHEPVRFGHSHLL